MMSFADWLLWNQNRNILCGALYPVPIDRLYALNCVKNGEATQCAALVRLTRITELVGFWARRCVRTRHTVASLSEMERLFTLKLYVGDAMVAAHKPFSIVHLYTREAHYCCCLMMMLPLLLLPLLFCSYFTHFRCGIWKSNIQNSHAHHRWNCRCSWIVCRCCCRRLLLLAHPSAMSIHFLCSHIGHMGKKTDSSVIKWTPLTLLFVSFRFVSIYFQYGKSGLTAWNVHGYGVCSCILLFHSPK